MTIGYGLMTRVDDTSNIAERALFPLVAALGTGCLFQIPLIALQAAMPLKDLATSTASFIFVRQLGGTIGVSIGQAIWSSSLRTRAAKLTGVTINTAASTLIESVHTLRTDYPDPAQRAKVIHAYTRSIATIWVALTPMAGFCFVIVLFIRAYTLKRAVVRGGAPEKKVAAAETETEEGGDLEKGQPVDDEREGEERQREENVIAEKRVEASLENSAMEVSAPGDKQT